MVNEEQLGLIKEGVSKWNEWLWKNATGIIPEIDLSDADLSGADLSTADLTMADLSRADLSMANLSWANLNEANLNEANLNKADLNGANLSEADLIKANLSNVNASKGNLFRADLSRAYLNGANLRQSNLSEAYFREADLSGADLGSADLSGAYLNEVILSRAYLNRVNFFRADLSGANLNGADLSGACLREANLSRAYLNGAILGEAYLFNWDEIPGKDDEKLTESLKLRLGTDWVITAKIEKTDDSTIRIYNGKKTISLILNHEKTKVILKIYDGRTDELRAKKENNRLYIYGGAKLSRAYLGGAYLGGANLSNAILNGAIFTAANLYGTNLSGSNLMNANLTHAQFIETNIDGANLQGCSIYGISAWGLRGKSKSQDNLIITPPEEPIITVDNIEIAQFIYLMLHNEKIRDVINTIGKKGVLILGRFTPAERKSVLDAIREKLRQLDYVPIVFDFERPTDRDFTETIKTLAGMCCFIIADITNPKSSPLELQAMVPDYMIPFVPIIQDGEKPFAIFKDLQIKYRWVLDVLAYDSVSNLIDGFEEEVIKPALEKHNQLIGEKAEGLRIRHIGSQIIKPSE